MAKCNSEQQSVVEWCIFCLIANEQDEETEVLAKNQDMVCFRDIEPAAPHHYLVVPREHIHSCLSLHRKHINLVKRMAEMGKSVLRDQGFTDMNDISLGFHRPPFISVSHLHLHVLAPRSQISPYMIYKFLPETDSFILDDQLVCFRDVKPGAAHHYLIVPRRHIDSCKTLHGDDVPLVEQMEKMGREILEKNNVCSLDDVRMGFHLPPFLSVPHLHLHALAPASKMDFRSQIHYGPHSYWFITVDKVLSQLKTQGRVK